ncbi:MAG TPA: hypothetical protein VF666_18640 [Pyrinomonadaceae bacterium]|jgi:hypothetical protein
MRRAHFFLALGLGLLAQMSITVQPALASGVATTAAVDVRRLFDESGEASNVERRDAVEIVNAPVALPTPLLLTSSNHAPAEPYMDAYEILKEDNSCSRFFGGSPQAIETLNRLTAQLRRKTFDNDFIAIKMSGRYTKMHNMLTGASYRIFDEAAVNSRGPFYNFAHHRSTRLLSIGSFPAHTRRARVLILLHELGHLVMGADGEWLLPNDGESREQSARNSLMVESRCIKQLLKING